MLEVQICTWMLPEGNREQNPISSLDPLEVRDRL